MMQCRYVRVCLGLERKHAFMANRTVVYMYKCKSPVYISQSIKSYQTTPVIPYNRKCSFKQPCSVFVQTRDLHKDVLGIHSCAPTHEKDRVPKDYNRIYINSGVNMPVYTFCAYFFFGNFMFISILTLAITRTDTTGFPLTEILRWTGLVVFTLLVVLARQRTLKVLRIYHNPNSGSYIAIKQNVLGMLKNVEFTSSDITAITGPMKICRGNAKLHGRNVSIYPYNFETPGMFYGLFPNSFEPRRYQSPQSRGKKL